MHEPGLHLAIGTLELQEVLGFPECPALDELEHVAQLGLPDVHGRTLPGVCDRGGEALDHLPRDPDHGLAWNRAGHVLRRLQGPVAGIDDEVEVGDGAVFHGVGMLRLPADAEDVADLPLSSYHQDLDQLGS